MDLLRGTGLCGKAWGGQVLFKDHYSDWKLTGRLEIRNHPGGDDSGIYQLSRFLRSVCLKLIGDIDLERIDVVTDDHFKSKGYGCIKIEFHTATQHKAIIVANVQAPACY